MNAKHISFKNVEKTKYTVYLGKANDFYSAMLQSYSNKNWHSVGLEAVHCAISITDCLLVRKKGIRCSSQDHRDLIHLLVDQIDIEETKKYANTLTQIIAMKNIVEYEDRSFREKEANDILVRTEWYYNWVKTQLP
jgi:hypothetical protein